MYYYDHQFYGMHLVWWCIWLVLLFWMFVTPYKIPGQRFRPDTAMDVLKKRYARGEINTEEYYGKKKILEDKLT